MTKIKQIIWNNDLVTWKIIAETFKLFYLLSLLLLRADSELEKWG